MSLSKNELIFDYVVVGSGVSGGYIAERLAGLGKRVCVLEKGGNDPVVGYAGEHDWIEAGDKYRALSRGRCVGLGGTSNLWGGQLIAPSKKVLSKLATFLDLSESDLEDYIDYIYRDFGFAGWRSLNFDSFKVGDFVAQWSWWIPFSRRNLKRRVQKLIQSSKIHCLIDCSIHDVELVGSKVSHLIVYEKKNPEFKKIINVRNLLIFCCGAFENLRYRQLLATKRGVASTELRTSFSDHVSMQVGSLDLIDRVAFSKLWLHRFRSGGLTTLRFECEVDDEPNVDFAYVHFTLDYGEDSVFNQLRATLSAVQKMDFKSAVQEFCHLLSKGHAVIPFLISKIVYKRLFLPSTAKIQVNVDLSWRSQDSFVSVQKSGATATVHWHSPPLELFQNVGVRFKDAFSELNEIANVNLTRGRLDDIKDIYHPFGFFINHADLSASPKSAYDAAKTTVDNAFAVDTGIIPSLGSANPGLIQLVMAKVLVDKYFRFDAKESPV